MWKVIAGKIERDFPDKKEAIKFACRFGFAQVINSFGFVQYVIRNYRCSKI